jgi:hypothetical protein
VRWMEATRKNEEGEVTISRRTKASRWENEGKKEEKEAVQKKKEAKSVQHLARETKKKAHLVVPPLRRSIHLPRPSSASRSVLMTRQHLTSRLSLDGGD